MRLVPCALLLLAASPAFAGEADPAATRLLAEARAARAEWRNFPGFTADVEVNEDGRLVRGTVRVAADGRVRFEGIDPGAHAWALRATRSLVAHRLPQTREAPTPCRFADEGDADHPLGRKVLVLNDELHSSYRIRDEQILEVNRVMKDARFTITVLENRKTPEGKYLPCSYQVSYWDTEGKELTRAEGHVNTWERVGAFDLPAEIRVITAAKPGDVPPLAARSITFRNHRLAERAAK
ncbi:MAG TPA: DUF3386 family protein [Gemmataceae bacterium]